MMCCFNVGAYSQLNLDYFKEGNGSNRYHETIEGLIEIISNNNLNLHTHKILDGYKFDDGVEIKFVIFNDVNGKFLDLLFFDREYGRWVEGEYTRWGINITRNLNHSLDRKIIDFNTNFNDRYKLIFDDDSYITIEFNLTKFRKSKFDGKFWCTKTYYEFMMEDHITEDNYKFMGHNSDYEYVDCK